MTHALFTAFTAPVTREVEPLLIPGPVPGNPVALRQFRYIEEWQQFILSLRLSGHPPQEIQRHYERMLRVLYLAWLDASVIKLAELAALASLEGTIKWRYQPKQFKGLAAALKHLVTDAGVRDSDLRVVRECGGAVISNLLRSSPPDPASLSEIRNRLAHGSPFELSPWGGLFEVVRDLIDFMYPQPESDS